MEEGGGGKGRRGLWKTLFRWVADMSGHDFHMLDICDDAKSKLPFFIDFM